MTTEPAPRTIPWLATLCGLAASLPAVAAPPPLALEVVGTHVNGPPFNTSAAEIVAHDPSTQRLFVVNAQGKRIDVLDINDPSAPVKIAEVDMSPYGAVVNSVAFHGGLVAVAVEGAVKTDPGSAVILDGALNHLRTIPAGALPDMLTFTPDGRYLLIANEGEPNSYNDAQPPPPPPPPPPAEPPPPPFVPSVDPEGSVTIVDLSAGVAGATVRTATFTAFNGLALNPGIRIYGPNATVAQDLEPEYIAVSEDSKTAWVTLQENNAMATIDIRNAVVTRLDGLGFKDHLLPGNGLDTSNVDGPLDTTKIPPAPTTAINIANWPLRGVYMPDSIASYQYRGQTFLVMANEGDTRNYLGFNEEVRVSAMKLDPVAFPNAVELKKPANLGNLTVTKVNSDPDNDGDVDVIYSLSGRSFSIRTVTGALAYDSGDDIEQITALSLPANFNCSNTSNTRDNRSTSKGPECEGLTVGKAYGRTLAFVGSERVGGIAVFDISNPYAPQFVYYLNTRVITTPFDFATAGDLGPEGLAFISEENSPTGFPMLAVAHEVSGTTTLFQVVQVKK